MDSKPKVAAGNGGGQSMHEFIATAKALADENRVRILMALSQSELCMCQIVELLKLAPSTVSRHVASLSQARLVVLRKDGRWHYFSLANSVNDPLAASAIEWMRGALFESFRIKSDRCQVEHILRLDEKECCDHHR